MEFECASQMSISRHVGAVPFSLKSLVDESPNPLPYSPGPDKKRGTLASAELCFPQSGQEGGIPFPHTLGGHEAKHYWADGVAYKPIILVGRLD